MDTVRTQQQPDPVRQYSSSAPAKTIDQATLQCLGALEEADKEAISRHIEELDREWDVERYLQTNASLLTLAGVLLGATKNKKWLAVPSIVLPFLLQHGLQGWCPPMPIFRLMGIRTRKEINREKYALKALRGDFNQASVSQDR